MKRGVQLLLDNCIIKVSGNREYYNGINVIEDYSAEIMSDVEYVSSYEIYSSDEYMSSNNDSLMFNYSKEG